MIHVFLVDAGTTYLVDVDLQHPVSQLNAEIARLSQIPVEKQVLLVSGGVPLFPDKPLFHYEATLVDNPVYLICKTNISSVTRPLSSSHSYSDRDLTSQVDKTANLPAALETVRARTQLAQYICQIDRNELKAIEKLVYDQHLQQQGWAAVVANLEDLVSGFEKRANTFQRQFREFLKTREDILSLLRRMPDVLILLEKIPVLPCLEGLASKTSVSLKGPLELLPSLSAGKLTLYIWMNSQDTKFRLEDVIRDLTTGTNQMGGELEERVGKEVQDVIKYASGPWPSEMKSIRGLEERLYGLDKLVQSAKTTMEGQDNMTKGFELNWSRLQKDVKDTSILPDLCTSHRTQMKEMLANHKKLLELKKKCADAKKELSDNLKQRLTWVMETHHLVNDMDNKLMLYYDWLNRIKRRTEFLQQVEQAPQVYAAMVVEVVRRQLFSQHYLKWAKGVAEESKKEHKKEMHRRKSFTRQFGSHFLQKLFVGFRDNVPKFATEAPKDVDSQLPEITPADVHMLSESVPELRQQLRLPTGTGSPALASSFQQPLAADGGSDPLMIEVTQSLASSTASFITQSVTSVTQSVSESVDTGQTRLLLPGERSRLSLSYQEGEVERQESKMPADDQLFLSLQDKFPVPQCLSETLTAEVNSAAMSTISASAMSASPKAQELTSALEELGQQQQQQQQQQQPQSQQQQQPAEGGGDGVLFSSGDLEPTKSSDSDAISHESLSDRKPRTKRRATKGLSDTSPDAETSQEFTTADFYIEDSMPSSITDSPPKPADSGKDRGEMDAALAEKTKRVGELEGEVSALQTKLAGSEEKLSSLQSMLNSDITALRESLTGIRECVRQSVGERVRVVSEVQEAVVRVCASLVASVEREKEEVVGKEKESNAQTVEGLEAQLQAKNKLVDELQQGMLKVSHGIADLNKELHQTRDSHQKETEALKEKHATELQEVTKKNILEVELETDRVRTELQERLNEQEAELQRLQEELEKSQSQLVQSQREKERAIESLQKEFAREKEEVKESLETRHCQAMEELKATLSQEEQRKLETTQREHSERKDAEMQQRLRELEEAFEKRMQEKEDELFAKHSAQLESVESEWSNKLSAKESELQKDLEVKLEKTKEQLQTQNAQPKVSEQGIQSGGGEVIPLERHQELLQSAESEARGEVTQRFEKLLEEERVEREKVLREMEEQHQRDKEDALHSLKTKVAAERQIQFNEAITRAVQEKDTLIAELRDQVDKLASATAADDESKAESQGIRKELEDIKEKEAELKGEKRRLEDEVLLLQRQLRQYSEQLHSMTASTMPVSSSTVTDSSYQQTSGGDEGGSRPTDWEQVAIVREQKINELETKLMGMSMTTSIRREVRDKVSILTCNVGDLVLLCLDERHDQYVVFTVGTTLHFLHSDCLEALGLKSAEGEPRKNWVLAEVTEREYCQARKAQNRFKVPVNTKFYRVKAKAWSPAGSSPSPGATVASGSTSPPPPTSSSS